MLNSSPEVGTVRPPAPYQITAQIIKGQRARLPDNTFMGAGKVPAIPFQRTGSGRGPLEAVHTLSVPQMIDGRARTGKEIHPSRPAGYEVSQANEHAPSSKPSAKQSNSKAKAKPKATATKNSETKRPKQRSKRQSNSTEQPRRNFYAARRYCPGRQTPAVLASPKHAQTQKNFFRSFRFVCPKERRWRHGGRQAESPKRCHYCEAVRRHRPPDPAARKRGNYSSRPEAAVYVRPASDGTILHPLPE